jgi:molecular chaperone Hsp33
MGGSVKGRRAARSRVEHEIAWRLFHEEREVRVERGPALERGCRCTVEHYRSILSRFPESERAEMRNEDGVIVVDCAFCSRDFAIDLD